MEWVIDDDNLQNTWDRPVCAESRWVGKTFEAYGYAPLLGNNNAAARLKTINNKFLFMPFAEEEEEKQ